MNLLCGIGVLFLDLKYGIALILIGAFLDLWDGLAARLLNAQSEFGAQLDSLADMVTFCVAPAYLLFQMLEEPYAYICFLIPLTGAMRLAKFNVSDDQSYYFKGLATPASGFMIAGLFLAKEELQGLEIIIISLVLLVCVLNVSNLKMFSVKGIQKDPYSRYYLGILITGFLVCMLVNWKLSFLLTIGLYVVLSFVYHFQITTLEKKYGK